MAQPCQNAKAGRVRYLAPVFNTHALPTGAWRRTDTCSNGEALRRSPSTLDDRPTIHVAATAARRRHRARAATACVHVASRQRRSVSRADGLAVHRDHVLMCVLWTPRRSVSGAWRWRLELVLVLVLGAGSWELGAGSVGSWAAWVAIGAASPTPSGGVYETSLRTLLAAEHRCRAG